tara:strand:+ start:85 stop:288 length:204 start_codon:yes stop_codon:yes gene_type:complete
VTLFIFSACFIGEILFCVQAILRWAADTEEEEEESDARVMLSRPGTVKMLKWLREADEEEEETDEDE